MENKKSLLKISLVVALIFIIGYLAGIGTFLSLIYFKSHPFSRMLNPMRSLDKLTDTLNLNQEQERTVEQILKQTQKDFLDLRDEAKSRIRKRLDQSRKQIASTLNEEQRRKFDQIVEKWEARFEKMHKRRTKWMEKNNEQKF